MKNTLLIVDDDDVMVLLLKKLFEKKYVVFTATDGVEAMCYLSQGIMPDLIISDLMMENITGYEFVKHLLTSTIYKHIPVIVVSSIEAPEVAKELPSIQIIHKPFDPVLLKNTVDITIDNLTEQMSCNN
jgi:two-component system chemotaxis response regulator CheY